MRSLGPLTTLLSAVVIGSGVCACWGCAADVDAQSTGSEPCLGQMSDRVNEAITDEDVDRAVRSVDVNANKSIILARHLKNPVEVINFQS